MRLIGNLQDHLESAIDAELVPGTNEPMPEHAALVRSLRREWKQAEELVAALDARVTAARNADRREKRRKDA